MAGPLYDLRSTLAWPDLSPRLAMRIGRAGTMAGYDHPLASHMAMRTGLLKQPAFGASI